MGRTDMHRRFIALSGFVAALAAVSIAAAKDLNLNRTAKSGVDSSLAFAGRWDRNCNALPATVTIAVKPTNGTATVVEADQVLPASTPGSGDTGACAGKTIKSRKIMYLSKPNFRGSDTLVYETREKDGATVLIRATVNITVQ
jgi:hypothetical protein